jgi:hypothetical protein
VYISRDVVFDETMFPFQHLHPNVGALLRKEILLLDPSLHNFEHGNEYFDDPHDDNIYMLLTLPQVPLLLFLRMLQVESGLHKRIWSKMMHKTAKTVHMKYQRKKTAALDTRWIRSVHPPRDRRDLHRIWRPRIARPIDPLPALTLCLRVRLPRLTRPPTRLDSLWRLPRVRLPRHRTHARLHGPLDLLRRLTGPRPISSWTLLLLVCPDPLCLTILCPRLQLLRVLLHVPRRVFVDRSNILMAQFDGFCLLLRLNL